jgi:hypothetical protein
MLLLMFALAGKRYDWQVTDWRGPDILPYTLRLINEKELRQMLSFSFTFLLASLKLLVCSFEITY